MFKQTLVLSLLSIATVGGVSLPAMADDAVVQTSTQSTYVEGRNNESYQFNEQRNSISRTRARRDTLDSESGRNTGVIQDSFQDSVVLGEGNRSYQEGRQVNEMKTRPARRGDLND